MEDTLIPLTKLHELNIDFFNHSPGLEKVKMLKVEQSCTLLPLMQFILSFKEAFMRILFPHCFPFFPSLSLHTVTRVTDYHLLRYDKTSGCTWRLKQFLKMFATMFLFVWSLSLFSQLGQLLPLLKYNKEQCCTWDFEMSYLTLWPGSGICSLKQP